MKNNKGFTLIELLATIALLAVIISVSFVSINAVIKSNKIEQCKNLVSSIKMAAKEYVSDNRYILDNNEITINNNEITINAADLKGYITLPIVNPITNENITNYISVVITLNTTNYTVTETQVVVDKKDFKCK